MNHILIIEDDVELSDWMKDYLCAKGYKVSCCYRGDTALDKVKQEKPDLIILDGMLPGIDGLDVCKAVRTHYLKPILMLTARDEEIDEVVGLEVGADDYLTKPVKPRVLLARIKAALRSHANIAHKDLTAKSVQLNRLEVCASSRIACIQGEDIQLSSNEFDLLWVLANRAGEIVTRETLVNELRGFEYDGFDRSIDLRISKLRKKLGDDPDKPFLIKTVWGKGYLLAKEPW
jgi:DNA-binding response OmpR family regulator